MEHPWRNTWGSSLICGERNERERCELCPGTRRSQQSATGRRQRTAAQCSPGLAVADAQQQQQPPEQRVDPAADAGETKTIKLGSLRLG